jgi:hypothetical protein
VGSVAATAVPQSTPCILVHRAIDIAESKPQKTLMLLLLLLLLSSTTSLRLRQRWTLRRHHWPGVDHPARPVQHRRQCPGDYSLPKQEGRDFYFADWRSTNCSGAVFLLLPPPAGLYVSILPSVLRRLGDLASLLRIRQLTRSFVSQIEESILYIAEQLVLEQMPPQVLWPTGNGKVVRPS